MPRILAIDDDQEILDTLARVLERDGHSVTAVSRPERVPHMDLARFDLILCDVMMPNLDGFELVRRIRGLADCPIVFLTAKVAEEDAVYGLGLGADDYLRKPFGAAELRAKVAAHLRREKREHHNALTFGRIRIDLRAHELFVDDTRAPLTPSEYEICEFLARHAGQTFSRSQIREAVFGWTNDSEDATVTVHVGKARAKLKAAGVDPIQTVWGMGYRWQI